MTETQWIKTIKKQPQLLGLSIEDNLDPTINWLQKRLNLDNTQIGKIVVTQPSVLSCSIDDNLEPKLDWLQSRLDLNDNQINKVIRGRPAILCLSITTKIEPTLRWLQDSLSLDDAALSKLIVAQPTVLGLDLEANLKPTLNFYKAHIGDEKGKHFVTQIPALLGYSLGKRLMPRVKQVREAGLIIDRSCIQRMAMMTDEKWQTSLAFQERKLLKEQLW